MLKFLVKEENGEVTVQQMKYYKVHNLGTFKRPRNKKPLKEVANIFLTNFQHIPRNWSNSDGTISENLKLYGKKYVIAESLEELIKTK